MSKEEIGDEFEKSGQPEMDGNVNISTTIYCPCSSRPPLHPTSQSASLNPETQKSEKPVKVTVNPLTKQGQRYKAETDNKEEDEAAQLITERQLKRLSEWIKRWRIVSD
ncbi:hypothetical protein LOAG_14033 [Loa loa]|nr:hypothetical protein LOAG_14033 [Loa loa]EFO14486.1 hypothetical protein LOAG_14033 [Loa loa]